jgi:hypothetical protein
LSRFKSPREYHEFVQSGNAKPLTRFYAQKNIPSVLDQNTLTRY